MAASILMRKAVIGTSAVAATSVAAVLAFNLLKRNRGDELRPIEYPDPEDITDLDKKVAELAKQYTPLAVEILKEAIRIPADFCEEDPLNGTSNHEEQRLRYLMNKIIEVGAVLNPNDIHIDEQGNLIWEVYDPADTTPRDKRKVIYFDGHSDTVHPLREQWHEKLGEGVDCYNGVTDPEKVNEDAMRSELGHIPPKSEWDHLVFGRGAADQLQGVVSQIIATKIMLETRSMNSLKGSYIVSIATICEEDNDGNTPLFLMKQQLPAYKVPDCVVITEGTGDLEKGPCGIYIGQRGRCQVMVEVTGKSSHGSMPNMGVNPLEYGGLIISEAAEQAKNGFKDNKFLGKGTRTVSWCHLETPSDCAVPAKFVFRFDRRMTFGEDSDMAVKEIESLNSVKRAREAGCDVKVTIPTYTEKSWKGYPADNKQNYMSWMTPFSNPAIKAAVEAYKRTVTQELKEDGTGPDQLRKKPRVDRWIFSTDGVGYPIKEGTQPFSIEGKNWLKNGSYVFPPMFGIGAGYEHHCHKLGEYVHIDHLWAPIAVMARFPSLFVQNAN